MWNEGLNQGRVEASSALRRAESVYYPPAIRASGPVSSKTDTASKVVDMGKASPANVLPSSNSLSKVAEQPGVVEKEIDTTKGLAPVATSPQLLPRTSPKRKRSLPR